MIAADRQNEFGFTIVELLIATLIFALVMLLCTMGVVQIGKGYYTNINRSNTQETARSIVDEIARNIEFNGGTIRLPSGGDPDALCINSRLFSFYRGRQLRPGGVDASHTPFALVATELPSNSCTPATAPLNLAAKASLDVSMGERELIGQRMRLARFNVVQSPIFDDLYTITVRVVYGDDDLLCSPSAGDCALGTVSANLGSGDLSCKLGAGSEFCAVSELTTSVKKRVQ